ncbi:glycosyltransferase family 2 protein [Hydrogenobaculum acidophilum]
MSLSARKISFIILTKNEEKNIGRAINSIKDVADEILVIDSGSEDKTVEIAKSLGVNVIFNEWTDYPLQVNFGISKTKNDIVFVLDADEELTLELKNSLKEFLNSFYEVGIVKRRTFYMGDFLKHVWGEEKLIRVFKKDVCKYSGELHETVVCSSNKTYELNGYINHYSFKSLKDQFERTLKYAKISADILCKKNKPFHFYNLIINPLWIFFKFFILKAGYKEGIKGLIIAFSGMFYVFMKYAFLYECYKSKEKELWK